MKTKMIKKSQIIAGALLEGFNNITEQDLSLLIEIFLKNNPDYSLENDYITSLANYISVKDDKISLWDQNCKDELKKISGIATNYFNTLDYSELLIRKIHEIGPIKEEELSKLFSEKEYKKIKELIKEGYLISFWNDNIPYENFKEYKPSKKGYVKYFKLFYKEELNKFIKEVKDLGYDINLIDNYLMSIDYETLELTSELEGLQYAFILNVENFEEYFDRSDISKFADNKDSKKELEPFNGRMDKEKKKIVLDFLENHPKCISVIGYGSGVIEQKGASNNDKKQIDLIIVVDDLRKWILDNINMNPNEFTKSTVKYFENADLKKLQKGAPIIYLSSIEYKGELIKMGIISKNSFMNSCYNKSSSYVPFRLEKAIEIIKEDEDVKNAIIFDHKTTLLTALLMLDKTQMNIYDLMVKICSLSYMGDFRMKIHCEDPNKVKNIIDKQFEYFKEDYEYVNNGYYSCDDNGNIAIDYEKIKTDVIALPYDVREIIEKYSNDIEGNLHYIDSELEGYYKNAAEKENLKQAIKGIKTVGLEKAFFYAMRKVKKGRKK